MRRFDSFLDHMNYENTKSKGNIAEVEAIRFFLKKGYSVSVPFGDNAPYDLIIESASKLYRVQVRHSTWKNNVLLLSVRASSGGKSKRLDLNRIDVFAVWDGSELFIVPTSFIGNRSTAFCMRREQPMNGQQDGINMAYEFREAVRFLP
jgi:hypothetical protein